MIFSLSESTNMEGNDFIIFKHGCGNDSTYHEHHASEFTDEIINRFNKPCENFIFYHVELEDVGNNSFFYKYEQPDDENETDEQPEDDSNPIVFKMRKATLLEWNLTESGKEEIWFDKAPEVILKSDRNKNERCLKIGWSVWNFFMCSII